jgi:hypothetical protein
MTGSSVQNDDRDSGLTIERLEKSLGEMVRRLEARIDRKMTNLEARFKKLSNAQRDLDAQKDDQDCELTVEKLEQCLGAMERRLEDKINKKMQSIDEKLKEKFSKLVSVKPDHAQQSSRENLEGRAASVENRLESIADAGGIVDEGNTGQNVADRKRLKEKLKEALEIQEQYHPIQPNKKEAWMEYIFGICKPDGRVGKRGSR